MNFDVVFLFEWGVRALLAFVAITTKKATYLTPHSMIKQKIRGPRRLLPFIASSPDLTF